MKAYKKLTPKQIAEKGNIGVTLGYPIPKGKELILTDLCALMQAKNTECVCLLAFSTDGKEEFAISFSSITRWGVENATDDESADRIGMFENTDYQSTFGNQLRFTGCVIDTNNLQNLFVPKWDKENSLWDFSLLKKREYPLCKVNGNATKTQLSKIAELVRKAKTENWTSFYGKFLTFRY